jgi:hypothetical protein
VKKWRKLLISVAEATGSGRFTVKKMNHSHRIAYVVLLWVFAVALTTALVLAGERNSEKKSAEHSTVSNAITRQVKVGAGACEAA